MTARGEKDRQLRLGILRWAYKNFLEHPGNDTGSEELPAELGADENDVVYAVERLARNGFIEHQRYSGASLGDIRIKAAGIEALAAESEPTILDDDLRYRILKVLYEAKRKDPHWGHVGVEEVVASVGGDPKVAEATVMYLAEADYADLSDSLVITDRGLDAYEAYEAHGLEGVGDVREMWQVTIGPHERAQALNLFRDITELATNEIAIIDRYAREPLFEMLTHVPTGVTVKVLTEDTLVKPAYQAALAKARQKLALEVRVLPKHAWPFHSRYLITDRNAGWVWDHSFHDAGETQHTVSSMKPVNRDKVQKDFNAAWPKATVV